MIKIPLFLLAVLFFPYSSSSQTYGYTHYDVTDGLAGSTVYCITQDKEGFIWVGTETGVSRFDGTHFINYSTEDGLPDVEILNMFTDSRGRVWMAPFYHSICYYYKGHIHNQENDSVLRRIRLNGYVAHFAEDGKGDILIQEKSALHLLFCNDSMRDYYSIGGRPLSEIETVSRSISGHFLALMKDTLYELAGDNFRPLFSHAFWRKPNDKTISPRTLVGLDSNEKSIVQSLLTGKTMQLPFSGKTLINYNIIADSLVYINGSTGTSEYNTLSGEYKRFLPGMEVSSVFRDVDGNTWFSTLGHGLYRLNSDAFRSISLNAPGLSDCAAYYIRKIDNDLLVGSNRHYVFIFQLPGMDHMDRRRIGEDFSARISYLEKIPNGGIFYASDQDIGRSTPGLPTADEQLLIGAKSAVLKSRNELLIANSNGGYTIKLRPMQVLDTFWRGRCTTLYYRGDTIFVGTLNGLYLLLKDRSVMYLGEKVPFLRKRVAAIAGAADGTLWVAGYDGGVLGWRDGRVIAIITHSQGLTSDICRTLTIRNNTMWVGTNRGLNRIDLGDPGYHITRYTVHDGLASDIINTVYADSTTVYAGTDAGLSFFEEHVHPRENCRLVLLSLISGNKDRIGDTAHLVLAYSSNNVRFDYAGISYRSAGSITYRYRLIGLDTSWLETKESFMSYPSLPSGDYEWQLMAINTFGVRSGLQSLKFTITTPYWKTLWFESLFFIVLALLVWLFAGWRIRKIRRQQQEKERLLKEMAELENRALQAQMNPHFIFNCLNSIQQYIFDQDLRATNRYITGFARLIRATLYNSSRALISVADEIEYLSTYLTLEKMRFKDKMDFIIRVEPDIDQEDCLLPPMLIQPYVENSMRHGLRHKTNGNGIINISMVKKGQRLVIVVEDNGIGRQKAMEYKTREHIEYQSKGMSMTAERIKTISALYESEINVTVEDLITPGGVAAGTRIVLNMPEF